MTKSGDRPQGGMRFLLRYLLVQLSPLPAENIQDLLDLKTRQGALSLCDACRAKWNVYAKRPFGGPKQVLAYLSRYPHRIAIGNRRILALDKTARSANPRLQTRLRCQQNAPCQSRSVARAKRGKYFPR